MHFSDPLFSRSVQHPLLTFHPTIEVHLHEDAILLFKLLLPEVPTTANTTILQQISVQPHFLHVQRSDQPKVTTRTMMTNKKKIERQMIRIQPAE